MRNSEVGPLPRTTHTKSTQKEKGLNLRAKTIRLLEENLGTNLLFFRLCKGFLGRIPKSQTT